MKKTKAIFIILTLLALLLSSCGSPTTTNKSITLHTTPDFERGAYILTVEKEGKTATITENLYSLPMLTPSLTSYALLDGKVVYLEGIPHEYYAVSPYDNYNYDVALKVYDLNTMSSTTLQTASDIRLYKTNDTVMATIIERNTIQACTIHEKTNCQTIFRTDKDIPPDTVEVLSAPTGIWVIYDNVAFIDIKGTPYIYNISIHIPSLFENYIVGTDLTDNGIRYIILSPSGQQWHFDFTGPILSEIKNYAVGEHTVAIPYISSDNHIHVYMWSKTSTADITTPIVYKDGIYGDIIYEDNMYTLKVGYHDMDIASITIKEDGTTEKQYIAPYLEDTLSIVGKQSGKGYNTYTDLYTIANGKKTYIFTSSSPGGCKWGYLSHDKGKTTIAIIDGYASNTGTIHIVDISQDNLQSSIRKTFHLPYSGHIYTYGIYDQGLWVVISNEHTEGNNPLKIYYITPEGDIVNFTETYLHSITLYPHWLDIYGIYMKGNLWLQVYGDIFYLSPDGMHKIWKVGARYIYPYKEGILLSLENSENLMYIMPDGIQWNTKDIITNGSILRTYSTPSDIFYKTYQDTILLFYTQNNNLHMLNLKANGSILNDTTILTLPRGYITVGLWNEPYTDNITLTVTDGTDTISIAILQLLPSDSGYKVRHIIPIHREE